MREIHDMVLQREFARSRFERLFLEAEDAFRSGELMSPVQNKHMRWQIMAAPRTPVRVEVTDRLLLPVATIVFERGPQKIERFASDFSRHYDAPTPVLGGMATASALNFGQGPGIYGRRVKEERYRDGRYIANLEVTDGATTTDRSPHPSVPAEWLVIWFLRAVNWIAQVRRASGQPSLDFGLQFLVDNRHKFTLLPFHADGSYYSMFPNHDKLDPQLVASPIYEIVEDSSMNDTANLVFKDLIHSFGASTYGRTLHPESYDLAD